MLQDGQENNNKHFDRGEHRHLWGQNVLTEHAKIRKMPAMEMDLDSAVLGTSSRGKL